jgi:hypothetical protein
MRRNEELLRPHLVEVPKPWRRQVVPDNYFPGECFSRSIYFVGQSPHLPQALYVIGEAVCGGIQQHGWVEIVGDDGQEVVFDAVMQEFYSKTGYYEHAWPWYRFTRKATMWLDRKQQRQETWTYRWDCVLQLPWAKAGRGAAVDYNLDTAKRLWKEANP